MASTIHERRDEILRVAARHGAGNVRLFGSAARGEDTPDSDIDLLVDVTGTTTPCPGGTPWQAGTGGDSQIAEPVDTRSRPQGSRSAVKSQRAYVEHVLGCIDRITADSASGRDAVFRSHTLQDAIVRNLRIGSQDRSGL
jgi:hypothetical protein